MITCTNKVLFKKDEKRCKLSLTNDGHLNETKFNFINQMYILHTFKSLLTFDRNLQITIRLFNCVNIGDISLIT